MIKPTANEQLAIAPALAHDLLHDSKLFDDLWRQVALADPQSALAALTTRNTMESIRPGSGQGFIAGYLIQTALRERMSNTDQLQRLFD